MTIKQSLKLRRSTFKQALANLDKSLVASTTLAHKLATKAYSGDPSEKDNKAYWEIRSVLSQLINLQQQLSTVEEYAKQQGIK